MSNQIFVVVATVYVKAFPQIATNDDTAKSVLTNLWYVFKRYAALGHHMFVYDALTCGLRQIFMRKTRNVLGLRYAVKDILKDERMAVITSRASSFNL